MQEQKDRTPKINRLIREWQKGTVNTASFLEMNGFNSNLMNWYKNSRWIESVGRGAYKLAGDDVSWFGALFAIQKQLGLSVHAGGKTALELKGYAHYLSDELLSVYLYGLREEMLPQWFKSHNWNVSINYIQTNLFPANLDDSLSEYTHKDFTILISTPERAALEMLYLVPQGQGFSEASFIMENLTSLRPQLGQQLMSLCNSVKAKRLFMYFAEKHNHAWVNQLNLNKIDLGKGKRVIVQHGRFDKKYQITVPLETTF